MPVDLPRGLTVVECGPAFWCLAVPEVAYDAGVTRFLTAETSDMTCPRVVDGRRREIDGADVAAGRPLLVSVERTADIRPVEMAALLRHAATYRLAFDLPFLRDFLRAWYGVVARTLDDAGVGTLGGSGMAWLSLTVRDLATALFGGRTLSEALDHLRDKLGEFDAPVGGGEGA